MHVINQIIKQVNSALFSIIMVQFVCFNHLTYAFDLFCRIGKINIFFNKYIFYMYF